MALLPAKALFKLVLKPSTGGRQQIRMLSLDCSKGEKQLLEQLRSKISQLHDGPGTKTSFGLAWIDKEGDTVVMHSNEELLIALTMSGLTNKPNGGTAIKLIVSYTPTVRDW
jgi:hypothetical protein